jgi:hypothetical protein
MPLPRSLVDVLLRKADQRPSRHKSAESAVAQVARRWSNTREHG